MLHRLRFRLPLFVAAAALLAGCFQVESVLSVRPDGSAVLTEQISADGMMGLVLRKGARDIAPGDDRSDAYGDGVTVRSIDTSVMPGSVRITTVYEVPDVSALRYDLSNAFDSDGVSSLMGGGGDTFDEDDYPEDERIDMEDDGMVDDVMIDMEDGDMVDADTSSFRFAFTPGVGGAPAQLRVTSPTMGNFADTDMDMGPLSEMFGGESGDEEDGFNDMMVIMGSMTMRFSVQADALVDSDGGWTDGDRVALTDISMGTFLDHLMATGQTTGMTEPMMQDGGGVDLPGYRVARPGVTTIRLR